MSQKQCSNSLIQGFDFVELYVGNAVHAAHYLESTLGLDLVQRSGLETDVPDATSFLLAQGDVRIVVSSALRRGPISEHVNRHGDSVKDVAFSVDDVKVAFDLAVENGAQPIMEPKQIESAGCTMWKATVGTPGTLVHSFTKRNKDVPAVLPNGKILAVKPRTQRAAFRKIDHVALAVNQGDMKKWVNYYCSVFGFEIIHEEQTSTRLTAMRSTVVANTSREIKFPIVEPAEGKKRSQVEDFLVYHDGAGVQHIAILCDDICGAVRSLKGNGVEFLNVPDAYYEALTSRIDGLGQQQLHTLQETKLLVDRDEWGKLIQTFSQPVTSRPTLFFELIQRDGARGFGSGNIRALFEAIEREQAARAGW